MDYKKIIIKILKIMGIFIIIWSILNYINQIINPGKELDILGFKIVVADYKSTKPKISKGDLVITKYIKENDIKQHHTIVFKKVDKILVRNVAEISKTDNGYIYITKDSDNKDYDAWKLNIAQVEGKYLFKIPKIGYLFWLIKNKIFMTVIIILIILIIVYKRYLQNKRNKKEKNARKRRKNVEMI